MHVVVHASIRTCANKFDLENSNCVMSSVVIDLIKRNTNHNAFMYSVHHLLNATSFSCPNVNNVQQMCQLTDIVLAYKQKPSYNYIGEVLHYYTVNAV